MLVVTIVLLFMIAVSAWMLLHHLEPERDSKRRIVHRVDEILPQTQCQQCGYDFCETSHNTVCNDCGTVTWHFDHPVMVPPYSHCTFCIAD